MPSPGQSQRFKFNSWHELRSRGQRGRKSRDESRLCRLDSPRHGL